jgi:hypothetical protein
VLSNQEEAPGRDVHVDDLFVHDIPEASVPNMPLAGIRQIVGFTRYADLSEIVEQG